MCTLHHDTAVFGSGSPMAQCSDERSIEPLGESNIALNLRSSFELFDKAVRAFSRRNCRSDNSRYQICRNPIPFVDLNETSSAQESLSERPVIPLARSRRAPFAASAAPFQRPSLKACLSVPVRAFLSF